MRPARSRCSLAEMSRKTARVTATRRQRRAICISCVHLCWRAFADMFCPLRHDGMSAAFCRVRVTVGSGRPSTVQTRGRYTMPRARWSVISPVV